MCKSKAAGTSTSKLGHHLQTESLTSLSAQNLFADFAKCDKKRRPSGLRRSQVELVGRYALRQTRDACAVHFAIFSTGSIIPPGLHALTLAARSYALLLSTMTLHGLIFRQSSNNDTIFGTPLFEPMLSQQQTNIEARHRQGKPST